MEYTTAADITFVSYWGTDQQWWPLILLYVWIVPNNTDNWYLRVAQNGDVFKIPPDTIG